MKRGRIDRPSLCLFDRKTNNFIFMKFRITVRRFFPISLYFFSGFLAVFFLVISVCDIFLFTDERSLVDEALGSNPPSSFGVSVKMERIFYAEHGSRMSFMMHVARKIVTRDIGPQNKPSLTLRYLRPLVWALLMRAHYDSREVIAVYLSVVQTKEGQGIDLLSRRMFDKKFTDLTIEEVSEVLVGIRLPNLVCREEYKLKEYARILIARAEEID